MKIYIIDNLYNFWLYVILSKAKDLIPQTYREILHPCRAETYREVPMIDNLNYYRVFLAVAETGSVSRAAETLFISQPAVSKSIRNLEDALSVHLIERSSRGGERY